MAKALFLSLPLHGHTNPSLPLVRELVERGDEVIYYSADAFAAKIEQTGARYRPYRNAFLADIKQLPERLEELSWLLMRIDRGPARSTSSRRSARSAPTTSSPIRSPLGPVARRSARPAGGDLRQHLRAQPPRARVRRVARRAAEEPAHRALEDASYRQVDLARAALEPPSTASRAPASRVWCSAART